LNTIRTSGTDSRGAEIAGPGNASSTRDGFTGEELDFIINYDIKYRMGLSGGSGEEE
jgi:hypothetical protein